MKFIKIKPADKDALMNGDKDEKEADVGKKEVKNKKRENLIAKNVQFSFSIECLYLTCFDKMRLSYDSFAFP